MSNSDKPDEQKCGESSKRKRTESSSENIGSCAIPASPPKFISLDDVMTTVNGLNKMALAHEISMNDQFKLEKNLEKDEIVTPETSTSGKTPIRNLDDLQRAVKNIVHQAFWDSLKADLEANPPDYQHALILFKEIKENIIHDLLLPHHKKLRKELDEFLDLDLISQKCRNNSCDFLQYSVFILNVLSKICAPIRDEFVEKLKKTSNVIELYKGIYELMNLMKMDMANFAIQSVRPLIQRQGVEYERRKFDDFLKLNNDGLKFTKIWLQNALQQFSCCQKSQHFDEEQASTSSQTYEEKSTPFSCDKVLAYAFYQLLHWPNDKYDQFPETLMLDRERLRELKHEVFRLILLASTILTTLNFGGRNFTGVNLFKGELKNKLQILIKDFNESAAEDCLQRLSDICCHEVSKYAEKINSHTMDLGPNGCQLLKNQLLDLMSAENPVRKVLEDRLKLFLVALYVNKPNGPVKVPSGLSVVEKELGRVVVNFLKLATYNAAVFKPHYEMLLDECKM